MLLAAAALLTVPDATGDMRGDGSYVLPTRPALNPDALDLRELQVQDVGGRLQLRVGLGAVQNLWNAPLGYSAGVLDVFVKSRLGGATDLAGLGFSAAGSGGWQYHLRVSGFGSSLEFVPDGQTRPQPRTTPLTVQLSGSTVVIGTPIPSGQYSYWVTMSVYSPFTPDGYLRPSTGGGESSLQVTALNAPLPVDVIGVTPQAQAYRTHQLGAVGQTRDRRALLLLLLAVAGLVLAVVFTVLVWRKR
ncbi:glucodextranase DOMON-like domain-containing protein [Deinococcus sonorensis]|uniref:Glucodextranase DOMON-like domain-containing protein n=2 Tax=Deinococcus sonorensis TaxID=309891 RepID=A0AAU7UF61_9DEIO